MYRNRTICVVIPAYNEELLIGRALGNVPEFVDNIVIIDDASRDHTWDKIREIASTSGRITALRHDKNRGVGAAIATGYKWCRDNAVDIAVVMAGDAQMDPMDLPAILDPVADNRADYSKGNRLFTGEAYRIMPKTRYFGNAALSLFTKIASGYWHVADSQSGYAAINKAALRRIDWDKMYPRYGQPNDILVRLNVENFRVVDVPIKPIYNIGEKSGIRLSKVLFTLPCLLLTRFLWRLKEKYVIRDFHHLVFFYVLGFSLLALTLPLTGRLFWVFAQTGEFPKANLLAVMFCAIMGLQSVFFAMHFDMEYNKSLK
jgi:glycosyltransferase involved in cell wall biosynthesis